MTPSTNVAQLVGMTFFSNVTDRVTTGVAVGAVTTPAWLPGVHDISFVAGMLLPILGCGWLALQIFDKLMQMSRARSQAHRSDVDALDMPPREHQDHAA